MPCRSSARHSTSTPRESSSQHFAALDTAALRPTGSLAKRGRVGSGSATARGPGPSRGGYTSHYGGGPGVGPPAAWTPFQHQPASARGPGQFEDLSVQMQRYCRTETGFRQRDPGGDQVPPPRATVTSRSQHSGEGDHGLKRPADGQRRPLGELNRTPPPPGRVEKLYQQGARSADGRPEPRRRAAAQQQQQQQPPARSLQEMLRSGAGAEIFQVFAETETAALLGRRDEAANCTPTGRRASSSPARRGSEPTCPRSKTPPTTGRQRTPPSPPRALKEAHGSTGSQLELTPAPSSPGALRCSPGTRVAQVTPPPLLKDSPKEDLAASETRTMTLLPPADPAFEGALTVVFDLDETLVSNRRPGTAPPLIRPFLEQLFSLIEGYVEVVVWTASTDDTGRPVIELLDPLRRRFHHLIFRNPIWFTEPAHTKDLSLLGRPLDRVLLVENTPNCCKFHRNNSLLVEDFTPQSQNDRMMLTVGQLVRDAAMAVRRGVSIPRFLQMRAQLSAGVEEYELGLPLVFQSMPVREAYEHINQLDPLMRPPLGNFFYVKNMRSAITGMTQLR